MQIMKMAIIILMFKCHVDVVKYINIFVDIDRDGGLRSPSI